VNLDIINIYENYKQIYVLEEGTMLDKIKAVIAASAILASGLQANDNRARMVTDKIKNKTAQELSQEYPNTVKIVQTSETLNQASENRSKDSMNAVSALVGIFWEFMNQNPEFRDEGIRIGTEYMKEAKKAETNNTSILPKNINVGVTNTNSESR
jgi:hypothetical protein